MPTIPKKSIIARNISGKQIAHVGETGTHTLNQVILNYAVLPKIFAFKQMYQGDDVYALLEPMFLDAIRSKYFNKRSEKMQQAIIEFHDFLKGACFELLDCVDDPQ